MIEETKQKSNISLEDRLWRTRKLAEFLSKIDDEKIYDAQKDEDIEKDSFPYIKYMSKIREKYFSSARNNLNYQINQLSDKDKARINDSIVKEVRGLDTSGISRSYQIQLGKDLKSFEENYSGAFVTFTGKEAGAYSLFSGKFSGLGAKFDGKMAGRRSRFTGEGAGNNSYFNGEEAGEYIEFSGECSGQWTRFVGESAGNRAEFRGGNIGYGSLFKGYMAGKHSQFHNPCNNQAVFGGSSSGKFIEFYGNVNHFFFSDWKVYGGKSYGNDRTKYCKLDWEYTNIHGYKVSADIL